MRLYKIITIAFVLLVLAACNSRRFDPPADTSDRAPIGKTSEGLTVQGAPCLSDANCETQHCVDAVCCADDCHGGARDNFTCSDVYGVGATPIVNGTCTQIFPGD